MVLVELVATDRVRELGLALAPIALVLVTPSGQVSRIRGLVVVMTYQFAIMVSILMGQARGVWLVSQGHLIVLAMLAIAAQLTILPWIQTVQLLGHLVFTIL